MCLFVRWTMHGVVRRLRGLLPRLRWLHGSGNCRRSEASRVVRNGLLLEDHGEVTL
jgi:hypothetical protein